MEREKIEYKKGMGPRKQVNMGANKVYYNLMTKKLLDEYTKALDERVDKTILPLAVTANQGVRKQIEDSNKPYYDKLTKEDLDEFVNDLDAFPKADSGYNGVTGKRGFINLNLEVHRELGASEEELERLRKQMNDDLDNELYMI